jgi:hypothetical protein
MELEEVGAEAVVTIAVEEEAVVYSGTELIIIIEEDYINIKTLEEIAGETTQDTLDENQYTFCYNYKYLQIICYYYKKVLSKYLDKKNNKENQGDKREYTRITRVISISKIEDSDSYTYYR